MGLDMNNENKIIEDYINNVFIYKFPASSFETIKGYLKSGHIYLKRKIESINNSYTISRFNIYTEEILTSSNIIIPGLLFEYEKNIITDNINYSVPIFNINETYINDLFRRGTNYSVIKRYGYSKIIDITYIYIIELNENYLIYFYCYIVYKLSFKTEDLEILLMEYLDTKKNLRVLLLKGKELEVKRISNILNFIKTKANTIFKDSDKNESITVIKDEILCIKKNRINFINEIGENEIDDYIKKKLNTAYAKCK
jgi:hypothetical protein